MLKTVAPSREFFQAVAERAGSTELIVSCALTPIYESRAERAVGTAGVAYIKQVAAQIRAEEGRA